MLHPVILPNIPEWIQTQDPAMDGDGGSGPNSPNNCGPESCAMGLAYARGLALDADYLWDVMQRLRARHGEPTGQGYTTVADIVRVFQFLGYPAIPTNVFTVDTAQNYTDSKGDVSHAPAQLLSDIYQSLSRRHALIGLFSFTKPNAPDGHFRLIYGMDPTAQDVYSMDPLKGKRVESYSDFWAWSKGIAVEIRAHRGPSH